MTVALGMASAACGAILGFDRDYQEVPGDEVPGDASTADGSVVAQDGGDAGSDDGDTGAVVVDTGFPVIDSGPISCAPLNGPCSASVPCCQTQSSAVVCSQGECAPCGQPGDTCLVADGCCAPLVCHGDKVCSATACVPLNGACAQRGDCCLGHACFPSGKCEACVPAGVTPDAGASLCCSGRLNDAGTACTSGAGS
jgi:hypothetical protein